MKTFIAKVVNEIEEIPVYKWNECEIVSRREISKQAYEEVRISKAGTKFRVIRSYK
jgi:hypothetical protein